MAQAYRARRSSIVAGSLWMIFISLVLFFLPLVNGLVGGAVGGYRVGGIGRAFAAALLPAGVVAAGLWGLLAYLDLPVVGAISGAAVGLLVVVSSLGILVGALVGGALAPRGRVAA